MSEVVSTYYGVMQYIPDMGRLEAANVGVVLMWGDDAGTRVMIDEGLGRVRRFFGADGPDYGRVLAAVRAVRNRIRGTNVFEGMAIARSRANDIRITDMRPMKVEDPDASIRDLFNEMVTSAQDEAVDYQNETASQAIVRSWPDWKQKVLGAALPEHRAKKKGEVKP